MLRTTATAMVLGLGLTLAPIGSADAAPGGNRAPVEASGTFDVHDLCPFPVHIEAHVVGASTTAPQPDGGSIVRTTWSRMMSTAPTVTALAAPTPSTSRSPSTPTATSSRAPDRNHRPSPAADR